MKTVLVITRDPEFAKIVRQKLPNDKVVVVAPEEGVKKLIPSIIPARARVLRAWARKHGGKIEEILVTAWHIFIRASGLDDLLAKQNIWWDFRPNSFLKQKFELAVMDGRGLPRDKSLHLPLVFALSVAGVTEVVCVKNPRQAFASTQTAARFDLGAPKIVRLLGDINEL